MGTTAHPTLAETMRRLGPIVNVTLQPFSGHYTGELWNVSVNHHTMGQGETLEMALADLAAQLAKQGN